MSTPQSLPPAKPADDSAWRERLLASLRDCGVQRAPQNWELRWFIALLVVATIAFTILVERHLVSELLNRESHASLRWGVDLVYMLSPLALAGESEIRPGR